MFPVICIYLSHAKNIPASLEDGEEVKEEISK